MDKIHYRVASEADIDFIDEVNTQNITALHGVPRSFEIWQELLSDSNSIYYIVYTAAPAAWFRIDLSGDTLWLGMLQVNPEHQRKGLGRAIVSAVEQIAKEKGYRTVGIHTTQDNIAAQALYLSCGYTVTEIGPCTTADGIARVGYTFRKDIQNESRFC